MVPKLSSLDQWGGKGTVPCERSTPFAQVELHVPARTPTTCANGALCASARQLHKLSCAYTHAHLSLVWLSSKWAAAQEWAVAGGFGSLALKHTFSCYLKAMQIFCSLELLSLVFLQPASSTPPRVAQNYGWHVQTPCPVNPIQIAHVSQP